MSTFTWSIPNGKGITGQTYIKDTDEKLADTIDDLVDFVNGEGVHDGQGLTFDLVDKVNPQTITGSKTFTSPINGDLNGNVTGDVTGNTDTATQLTNIRTFTLIGDVSGTATFDGTADVNISTEVENDSHEHTIDKIDGLQAELDSLESDIETIENSNGLAPTGMVITFAGSIPPTGYLECDGSELNRTEYSTLFATIGGTYGEGDGSATFNLPDLRGEFVRGLDSGRGIDTGRTLGSFQEQGLPDIEGEPFGSNFGVYGQMTPTGAFYGDGGSPRYNVDNDDNSDRYRLKFAASRSNPIYGSSDDVQIRNIALMYCIKT